MAVCAQSKSLLCFPLYGILTPMFNSHYIPIIVILKQEADIVSHSHLPLFFCIQHCSPSLKPICYALHWVYKVMAKKLGVRIGLPILFWGKCIRENVYGKTSLCQFWEKLVVPKRCVEFNQFKICLRAQSTTLCGISRLLHCTYLRINCLLWYT